MDQGLTQIEELFKSRDPQMRIFGLICLENQLDELPFDAVEKLLLGALGESDRVVVEQAKRIQSIARSRTRGRFGIEGELSILGEVPEAVIARFPKVSSAGVERLRASALDLVSTLVQQVHSIIQAEGDIPMERAAEMLGSVRMPASIPLLESMLKKGTVAKAAIKALAAYRSHDADKALLAAAAEPGFPEAPLALESVGGGDPKTALVELRRYTEGSDARMRRAACVALGGIKDPQSVQLLSKMLRDPAEEVQIGAILALGRLRSPEGVEPLVNLGASADSAKIRASVAAALGKAQGKAAEGLLRQYLQDNDQRTRANAIESLAFYPLPPEDASRMFTPFTKVDVPRVRGNAILSLYKYRPSQALDALAPMFRSNDKIMRMAACYCASQIQTHDSAHWFTTLIQTEQDLNVLKSAMQALQRFTRREAVDLFLRLNNHPRLEVRVMAMHTLGAVGGQTQLGTLMGILKREPERKVRAAIVTAVARVAGLSALSVLPPFLQDQDDRVVANAIEGLQSISNIETVGYLKPLVNHRGRRVRANAIRVLFSLGEFKVLNDLARMIESRDRRDLASGLWALGAIGNDFRLSRLEENYLLVMALKDHYRKVLDSSSVPGASLRMKMKGQATSEPAVNVPPPMVTGALPSSGRSSGDEMDFAALSSISAPEEDSDLGAIAAEAAARQATPQGAQGDAARASGGSAGARVAAGLAGQGRSPAQGPATAASLGLAAGAPAPAPGSAGRPSGNVAAPGTTRPASKAPSGIVPLELPTGNPRDSQAGKATRPAPSLTVPLTQLSGASLPAGGLAPAQMLGTAPGTLEPPAEIDLAAAIRPTRPKGIRDIEAMALAWERVLDLLTRDAVLARKEAQQLAASNPSDEVALYLHLLARKETGDPALEATVRGLAGRELTYFPLLYFLARELKAAGLVDESVWTYHQIFRSQLHTLDALATLAQKLSKEGQSSVPPQILKLLCSFQGLLPGLDLELGNFYLLEKRFDDAFMHLYRARIANPGDVQTALKLAYLCRKERRVKLGKVLCGWIIAVHPEGTPEHEKAGRIISELDGMAPPGGGSLGA